MSELDKLMEGLAGIKDVKKIVVSSDQLKVIESLCVTYMSIARAGFDGATEKSLMGIIDSTWDSIFEVDEHE